MNKEVLMTKALILHNEALLCVEGCKRSDSKLISALQEIDKEKAFLELGFSSLFTYACRGLKLGESDAYRYINVARKAAQVPALQKAIDEGELNVSKASRITSVINTENSSDWIKKAEDMPQKELELEVVKENPKKSPKRERIRPVTATRAELRLGISLELEKKLTRIKTLLSQKKSKPCSLEEVLEALTDSYLKKQDPIQKAERHQKRKDQPKTRKPIKAEVKHEVTLRDQGQCAFISPLGIRCEAKQWTQLHHKKPVSQGGENTVANLITLCSSHHRWLHQRQLS